MTQIRTCLSCAEKKPLAAFLQITGTKGTVYGSVCSTCRSKKIKEKAKQKPAFDEDQGGSSSTGLRLDAKAKIKADLDNKEITKKTKDDTIEETKQEDFLDVKKLEKTEAKLKSEKDHRQNYIEKKFGFLGYQAKTPLSSKDPAVRQATQQKQFSKETQERREAEKIEQARSADEVAQNVDFGQMSLDSQAKYRSEVFQRFRAWVGKDNAPEGTNNNALDHIEKNWKPGSTRKR